MLRLIALLHATLLGCSHRLSSRRDDERGSLTIEQALWAAAAVVLVGIVYAVFKSYINTTISSLTQ